MKVRWQAGLLARDDGRPPPLPGPRGPVGTLAEAASLTVAGQPRILTGFPCTCRTIRAKRIRPFSFGRGVSGGRKAGRAEAFRPPPPERARRPNRKKAPALWRSYEPGFITTRIMAAPPNPRRCCGWQKAQAGILASGSTYSRRPSRRSRRQWPLVPLSSPVTVAGPRRNFTGFPAPRTEGLCTQLISEKAT